MSTISLTLAKVTPSSKGGFICTWKSVGEQINTPLGVMKSQSHRYCTKSLNELPIGTVANIDLSMFEIRESEPFEGDDGNQHTTKWLRVKA